MSVHVRDLMARAAAYGLGTITNLEKMAAFLKVLYGARFMVKGRATLKTVERNFYTSSLDHWSAHTFLYTGFTACTIGENSA